MLGRLVDHLRADPYRVGLGTAHHRSGIDELLDGSHEAPHVVLPALVLKLQGISPRQWPQRFRKFLGCRHSGALDEDGDDWDTAPQGGVRLQPDEVHRIVEKVLV